MNIDQEDDGTSSLASASQSSLSSSFRSSFSESDNQEVDFPNEESIDPEFKAKFDEVKSEFIKTRNQAILIQRKLIDLFPALGFDDSTSTGFSNFPNRYQETLDRLESRRNELERIKSSYETQLQKLHSEWEESDQHLNQKEEAFRKMREDAGRKTIIQRTNRPIKLADLNSKENQLSSKEFDLEQARIEFVRTKDRYKQTEAELSKQDQLSEGLHLIDFEQLKIEKQSLKEKKAEKTQDLEKIRQKIEINAHTLTHVKEKLNFVMKQKAQLQQKQAQMDGRYSESRSKLATARIRRDKVRDENSHLKKSSGLIGMTDLLYDFENKNNELELMQDKLTELKTRFNDLTNMQHELEAKISQRQPLDTSYLKLNR
ncbi:coiled-coil domain-containing protein [Histomonas meleagridis]|uniref:coiled-coil domain-containing protein 96 n=1 Tax=Histomonas meleagridis TaxID=135588 RepID=UPI003559D050|nr:coiled-coil domain-containing protein [Histomonas meleagridis]KAH0802302.1 coiled-coil domain-containing protein 96 [Histomonas meleagridis]